MSNTMNTPNGAGAELGVALIKALGLPRNTSKLTLRLEGGKTPVVEIEHYPDAPSLQGSAEAIQPLAGRFELRPLGEAGAE